MTIRHSDHNPVTHMPEVLVPYEAPTPPYSLVTDEETGVRTATIQLGNEQYSVAVPAILDSEAILADKRRSSRATGIERMMGGDLEDAALVNRTVQLVAFDAYEAGAIPKEAWDEFRVGTTLVHMELRKTSIKSSSVGIGAAALTGRGAIQAE